MHNVVDRHMYYHNTTELIEPAIAECIESVCVCVHMNMCIYSYSHILALIGLLVSQIVLPLSFVSLLIEMTGQSHTHIKNVIHFHYCYV